MPAFLEKRVYQGSSGRASIRCRSTIASPRRSRRRAGTPCTSRTSICEVMILPELGGRIHDGRRQDQRLRLHLPQQRDQAGAGRAGRPVDLAAASSSTGRSITGRRRSCRPTWTIEQRAPTAAVTVWCSDHDPMTRMKGMHGVRLRPGRAVLELRVRALQPHRRSSQTFLWWANVAARVHDDYQSFFPPDVTLWSPTTRSARSARSRCRPATIRRRLRRHGRIRRARAVRPAPTPTASTGTATSPCRRRTCASAATTTSSAATTTRARPGSCTSPTTTSRRARSSGPGATTSSATRGTAT